MTTKLRSACDRCHQTKVRCSGDMPCQGCLSLKSLCFYSVSNPLGRPRGSKKGQNRTGSASNDALQKDAGSDADRTTTKSSRQAGASSEQGTGKRASRQQASNSRKHRTPNRRSSESLTIAVSDDQGDDASSAPTSAPGGQALVDNLSGDPTHQSRNGLAMSNVPVPTSFTMHSLNSADSGAQMPTTLPHSLSDSELSTFAMSDVVMSDFGSLATSHTQSSGSRDPFQHNFDGGSPSDFLRTSPQDFDFQHSSKVGTCPPQQMHTRPDQTRPLTESGLYHTVGPPFW